jgi:hypothetical protein
MSIKSIFKFKDQVSKLVFICFTQDEPEGKEICVR